MCVCTRTINTYHDYAYRYDLYRYEYSIRRSHIVRDKVTTCNTLYTLDLRWSEYLCIFEN